ncbi:MAG: NAD(P)H-binding protein [Myxococcales bacterium]|nr:NAD(P)H-binding protein [Myxococcales bacterium]
MYVISGVTGHTGKVAADTLLARGEAVRVVVRDAARGAEFAARGAEVAVADLADADALARAFAGARGAYVLLPPNLAVPDLFAWQAGLLAAIKSAAAAAALPHLVFLSSIGASQAAGTGPIVGVHRGEQALLGLTGTRATFLRAGYFHENIAGSLGTLAEGRLISFFPADFPLQSTATRDIGELAAALLLAGPGEHGAVVELGSPVTSAATADAIGRVTGRRPELVVLPASQQAEILRSLGAPAPVAALYQEMTLGLLDGRIAWEPGRRHVDARTPIDAVLRDLLAPAA